MKYMSKKIKKGILIALLSIVCALVVAGSALVIYTYVNENTNASQEQDDENWTGNY